MKTAKRFTALIMLLAMLVSFAIPASAASGIDLNATARESLPNMNSISIRTYALQLSGRIYCYTNEYLNTRGSGWIDMKTDECYIQKIANNGKALYIKYPIGGGQYTSRWFSAQEFLGANLGTLPVLTVTSNITTYRRYNGGSSYGYAAAGDKIYVVSTHNDFTGIIYPLSAGGYKLGYVKNQDLQNRTRIISDMIDVTAYFAGKTITMKSVENGKYLSTDLDVTGAPLRANRDGAYSWETLTVSALTSDGWVGFKAYNGKYLSATNNETNTPIGARANRLLSWECFRIYQKGNDYYIKAQVNGKWLCVRTDINGAPVQAYANAPLTWERIQICDVNGITFSHPMKEYHTKYTQWGVKPSYRNGSSRQYHVGVDYMSDKDSCIYAFADGKVVGAGWNNANGNFVLIEHSIPDQNGSKKTVYSFYAHLASYSVKCGDTVSAGTVIGQVGATGSSSGGTIHLHFSVFDRKWTSGGAYGYVSWFTGDKVTYDEVTYYNPYYIIANGKLP